MSHTPADQISSFAIKENFLKEDPIILSAVKLVQQRVKNMQEIAQMTQFIFIAPEILLSDLQKEYAQEDLNALKDFVMHAHIDPNMSAEEFFPSLKKYCKNNGLAIKNLAFPLRHILTGSPQSPDLGEMIAILSLNEVYTRIERVLI
jgi:glutamyl/glutaminyl-tRNA synthetase